MATTITSCPGKVLVAGGYLVLDPAYTGLVISTPSKFYTVVKSTPLPSDTKSGFRIAVKSPQFLDGDWSFEAKQDQGSEWRVKKDDSSPSNPFVQLAISATLLLVSALTTSSSPRPSLTISIVGSNDFYSQSRADSTPPPPFVPLNVRLSEVHKTGLGSSAAMVTSLVSSLFLHWNPLSASQGQPDTATKTLIHNLAQYVHSLAQGKVGSGFDVSAAVWGSQSYRRFSETCLASLLSQKVEDIKAQSLFSALSENSSWTAPSTKAVVSAFSLPPLTTLILADVDAGSNTPSMVGKVLAWKKASPGKAQALWTSLKDSNSQLQSTFEELKRLAKEDFNAYTSAVEGASQLTSNQWADDDRYPFLSTSKHILRIRKLMKEMGDRSSVPIEPSEQTSLLDACSALPGVVGAGVPGAGGYDAIWVLVLSSPASSAAVQEEVTKLLLSWKEMSVRPLSKEAWAVGVKDEDESRGLTMETLEKVPGLKEAVNI